MSLYLSSFLAYLPREGQSFFLDDKAISGLKLYKEYWPVASSYFSRERSASEILFGRWQDPASLPFDVTIIPQHAAVPENLIKGSTVVLGSGDNYLDLPLAGQCEKSRYSSGFCDRVYT